MNCIFSSIQKSSLQKGDRKKYLMCLFLTQETESGRNNMPKARTVKEFCLFHHRYYMLLAQMMEERCYFLTA